MDWRSIGDRIREHGRGPVALTVCYAVLWLATWTDAQLLFRFSSLPKALLLRHT